jgi:hypothetical protein
MPQNDRGFFLRGKSSSRSGHFESLLWAYNNSIKSKLQIQLGQNKDKCRGRQTWCKAAETAMKSEGHFYASRNYVLQNPVHHGYCSKWTEWPFSSAAQYIEAVGREAAHRFWSSYPLHDFGKDWDPPSL